MSTEAAQRARFDRIRYAQVWEDADTLLNALAIQPRDTCLSIASAGDNALAMLTADPRVVYAIDLNPAQLACVRLRMSMYRVLDHGELLELVGSRAAEGSRRHTLYQRCRPALDESTRRFWDARSRDVARGVGDAGKFENYFRVFRRWVLPLVHSRRSVEELLTHRHADHRRRFYDPQWNSFRWRMMFRVFFNRFVMGRLGRDPAFFRYAEDSVADHVLRRTEHALATLDPSANPYLQWILAGRHRDALPLALRPEHFETISSRLDRLVLRKATVESFLSDPRTPPIDRFNLSDIFEYMSKDATAAIFSFIADKTRPGARMVYWNMLVPRQSPDDFRDNFLRLDDLASQLHAEDKAFFYSRLLIEERR